MIKQTGQALYFDMQKSVEGQTTSVSAAYYVNGQLLSQLTLPCNVYGYISPEATHTLVEYLSTIMKPLH